MRKHALLKDYIVCEVKSIDDAQYMELSSSYQLIIDIEDMIPQPEVGWVLEGNKLVSQGPAQTQEQYEIELASKKTKHGRALSREAIDKIGARNKILNKTGAQVSAVLNQLVSVKLLLETGALGTARYVCTQLKAAYPEYSDIFDLVIASINDFEQKYGL